MKIITDRLTLRPWHLADAEFLFELNNNPEVIKFTGDPPFDSIPQAQDFIQDYTHYQLHGYGRWLCELTRTGDPIGWCGLKNHEEEGFIDLGYRFLQSHWGQGFATESAFASLVVGFNHFRMNSITARAMIENKGSFKVMEKLGMKYEKDGPCGEEPARYFTLGMEEFLALWPSEKWPTSVRIL